MVEDANQFLKFFSKRFLKFSVTGGLNTAIAYLSFVLLTHFSMNYMVASTVGYILALINSFLLNKNWAFESGQVATSGLFFKFTMVNLLSLGINLLALYIFFEILGLNLYLSQMLAIIFSMISNYLGYKLIFIDD